MRIISSSVDLSSSHTLLEKDIKQESTQFWMGRRPQVLSATVSLAENLNREIVNISEQGRNLLKSKLRELAQARKAADEASIQEETVQTDPKIKLVEILLSAMTGKDIKINIVDLKRLQSSDAATGLIAAKVQAAPAQPNGAATGAGMQGWGFRYDYYEAHIEQETTKFSADGSVTTADGRQISFALDLAMTRQYMEENRLRIRAGDALIDPLVINFAAPAASLTAQKYSFDLNVDGVDEQIAFVGRGSGFLTLDVNSDGRVNDGSELFGPKSGNGFSELAKFDADGNNWIDENDAVYGKLRIWTKDEKGQDVFLSLQQAGVGAIYLGNIATSFSLKNDQNQLQGQVQTSGIFLRENGLVGTVQQVDLAV